MSETLTDYLQERREETYVLLRRYLNLGKTFLLRSNLRPPR